MRVGVVVLGILLFPQVAVAQSYLCTRPSKPDIPTFAAGYSSMQSAQRDVDDYLSSMKQYVECLSNEQNDAIREDNNVLDDWNDAVNRFNNG